MTLENTTRLQALIQDDPHLAQQLNNADTLETAAQLLAHAASQRGVAVDADVLIEYLVASKAASISDDELDAIAGGSTLTKTRVPWSNPKSYIHVTNVDTGLATCSKATKGVSTVWVRDK